MKVEAAERLSYPGGYPVFPSRYVIFGGDPRHVALRFVNASDIVLTGVRFTLVEKDAKGETIKEQKLEYRDLFSERNTEFSVPDAIIGGACVSVEVHVEAVFSDGYEYTLEEDGAKLTFGESEPPKPEPKFLYKRTYKVRRKRKRYVLYAFLAVLAFAAITLALAWRVGILDKIEEVPAEGMRITTEYVEA